MAETQHTNRLINEASPYLLQHARNPVDWYAWGIEAFEAARAQEKPIFLSVGYSTCYWCHVMERECFESDTIAAIMNEHFINVKVDREERPDVDDVYITAVQLMTHSGGWPMSLFLEPFTLKPFLGGTYFPPDDRYGRIGFPSVLRQVTAAWTDQREKILEQAEQVAQAVTSALTDEAQPVAIRPQHVEQAIASLMRTCDTADGGFGGASGPKFPMPANLDMLLRSEWDKPQIRQAVTHTLDRMATGGIYDHIGGGFHRYSVDGHWLVPHFEKMLYDNGQLLSTYARAYELTRDPLYARILHATGEYVLREMTNEHGGFFSAQDAEVNHREGENYLWTATQVREALAEAGEPQLAEFALEVYGLNRGTNFRDPHHPEDGPKNVIHLIAMPAKLALTLGLELSSFYEQLDHVNKILLAYRNDRDQPSLDDKVICGWNGLMIAGLADAGRVLGEARFVDPARHAATFIMKTMQRSDGSLVRTYRNGKVGSEAFFEDYAFVVHGLLALHRVTNDELLLRAAIRMTDAARKRFWDTNNGGYFNTLPDQPDMFVRGKGIHDGAIPAGNSVMMLNLLRLRELTGTGRFLEDALATMRCLSHHIAERPTSVVLSVLALYTMFDEHPEAMRPLAMGDSRMDDVVQVTCNPQHVQLVEGHETALVVTLRIADGFHINAHQSGQSHLIGMTIDDDESGLELDVLYSEGEPYERPEAGNLPSRVHRGTVTLPVRLRYVGEVDSPRLMLEYQPCSDRACLQPRRVTLPVNITIAT